MTSWWGDDGFNSPVVQRAMALGASQDPWELGQVLRLVEAAQPEIVVEIGCDRGGTLYAWGQVCPVVYGITLSDNGWQTGGSGQPLERHGAVVLTGDSHDPASREWLARMLANEQIPGAVSPVDVLVLDGDHTVGGVLADLAGYGPGVRDGGLILLHDIAVTGDPRAEVFKVWPDLRARFETTEIVNRDGGFGWGVITVQAGDAAKLAVLPA